MQKKKIKLPKSMPTLPNQISGCERNIKESLSQCAALVGDKNFQFTFSLNSCVNNSTTCDLSIIHWIP